MSFFWLAFSEIGFPCEPGRKHEMSQASGVNEVDLSFPGIPWTARERVLRILLAT